MRELHIYQVKSIEKKTPHSERLHNNSGKTPSTVKKVIIHSASQFSVCHYVVGTYRNMTMREKTRRDEERDVSLRLMKDMRSTASCPTR
jgi:hypothetical protein